MVWWCVTFSLFWLPLVISLLLISLLGGSGMGQTQTETLLAVALLLGSSVNSRKLPIGVYFLICETNHIWY